MDARVEGADAGVSAKHQKFRELAEKRTNMALDAIRRIGNLSNRQLYEFQEEEVRKIVKALRDAVSEIDEKFSAPKGRSSKSFRL